jgi:hypothetical protein
VGRYCLDQTLLLLYEGYVLVEVARNGRVRQTVVGDITQVEVGGFVVSARFGNKLPKEIRLIDMQLARNKKFAGLKVLLSGQRKESRQAYEWLLNRLDQRDLP